MSTETIEDGSTSSWPRRTSRPGTTSSRGPGSAELGSRAAASFSRLPHCLVAAAVAAFLAGAFSSTPGTTGALGPGPYFNPLELEFSTMAAD